MLVVLAAMACCMAGPGMTMLIGTFKGVCLLIVAWLAAMVLLRHLGKADPMMRQVYSRYFYQQRFYLAKSLPGTHPASIPKDWK